MADFDVVVAGAGHNGLVCAGYLARAGYRVAVVERRPVVGGAVVTEEIVPGYRFDLGGSAHILIHHTPIVADLDLTRYGLEYLDVDPLFFHPFPDGSHLMVWRDVDRTCESIAAVSLPDADAYRAFIARWRPMADAMVEMFLHAPTPLNLGRYLGYGSKMGRDWPERLTDVVRSYGHVARRSFTSPKVQALLAWMAAQSGPPPGEAFSAPFVLWHPLYHVSGIRRPRGGSGMLTQALARMIEAHGGTVVTGDAVDEILVRGGRAAGVATASGLRLTARAVVAATHIGTTLRLLGGAGDARGRRLLGQARTGNGFGMMLRLAVDRLPDYTALPSPPDGAPGPQHRALQFLCPSVEAIERAYADYLCGEPSREPGLIAMTFSAVDPTLAPPGRHTLFLWGQYYPYDRADGADWDAVADREADRMLALLARYAPNLTPDAVEGRLVETPRYLERTLGLLGGNVMHLEMTLDQMMPFRPAVTLANYRGPLPGLYLTGASTHPGGGIMGAAGRNAAAVVLRDLERRPFGLGRRRIRPEGAA